MKRILGCLVLVAFALPALAQDGIQISEFGTFRGVGAPLAALVGPGPDGRERYWISYSYTGFPADVVALDPGTGAYQVYPAPNPAVSAAWGMVFGPDGRLYLGTAKGTLWRIDPATGENADLGKPSASEGFIWELTLGADGRVYGCTYPNAKLVRLDPVTGEMADLGRLDESQRYARGLIAGPDGWLYIRLGVGAERKQLIAYHLETGERRDLLPEAYRAGGGVEFLRDSDGLPYARLRVPDPAASWSCYRLTGGELLPVETEPAPLPRNCLANGCLVTDTFDGQVTVYDPATDTTATRPYLYPGKELKIGRVGVGPDGHLYGATVMPFYLFRYERLARRWTTLGYFGDRFPGGSSGNAYALLRGPADLLLTTYATDGAVLTYAPSQPWQPGVNPYPSGARSSWRPWAALGYGPEQVWIGSMGGYGEPGGLLSLYHRSTRRIEAQWQPVEGQSVVTLTTWNGLVVGGTSTRGGAGDAPGEAKLFFWNPYTYAKFWEAIPVPGATHLDALTLRSGLVIGLAGSPGSLRCAFAFDPVRRLTVKITPFPAQVVVGPDHHNTLTLAGNGKLYGLCTVGLYSLDAALAVTLERAYYRQGNLRLVTAGLGVVGRELYFGSGGRLVCFTLPP